MEKVFNKPSIFCKKQHARENEGKNYWKEYLINHQCFARSNLQEKKKTKTIKKKNQFNGSWLLGLVDVSRNRICQVRVRLD